MSMQACLCHDFVVVHTKEECPVCRIADEIKSETRKLRENSRGIFHAGRSCKAKIDLLDYEFIQYEDYEKTQK